MAAKFEVVSKYADCNLTLPQRKTKYSAGYDFKTAEDIELPPHLEHFKNLISGRHNCAIEYEEMIKLIKEKKAKPTLVSTGIKCKLDPNTYLELSVRSSTPLKSGIVLANGVGIIDADYYNNPDNEGEIFFQLINLTPFNIFIPKGTPIGQGIIKQFLLVEDDIAEGKRIGGFGSTDG